MQTRQGTGSPPRMRGKVLRRRNTAGRHRITPAYAGKRRASARRSTKSGDHPRVCGEKAPALVGSDCRIGSPPRMRGKVDGGFLGSCGLGITPAYAGKRQKRSRSTVSPAAIVLCFPSVCNRPAGSIGNPAERGVPPFLPAENAVPALPAYSLRFQKAFCGQAVRGRSGG